MAGGLSLRTCTEIYGNPYDLKMEIKQESGKYILVINRGPRHRFKLLVDSRPFEAKSLDAAVEVMKSVLDAVVKAVADELSPNREGEEVLTPDLAFRILIGLREGKVVNTCEMEPVTSPFSR